MPRKRAKHRIHTIFDLDGNLFPGSEQRILHPFYHGVHEYSNIPGLDYEAFLDESHAHFLEKGCCVRGLQIKHGKDLEWRLRAYEYPVDAMLAATADLPVNERLILQVKSLIEDANHKVSVLTQGTKRYALEQLKRIQLLGIIKEEDVYGIRESNGDLKRDDNSQAYQAVLKANPGYDIVNMSEDTPHNLVIAKRDFDIWTYQQGPKIPQEDHLAYIDHRHADINGTLEALLTIR